MAQVRWLDDALEDLEAICLFIARSAPASADLFGARVFRTVERLDQFPLLGRVVPEFGRDDTRELFVQSYRVIYQVLQDRVEILAVRHGARLLREFDLP